MATIFERIVAGEIPSHRVWEDEKHLAFLDINPVVDGHTLVIPKKPVDELFDLEDQDYHDLWQAARHVAGLLKERMQCQRVVVEVFGFEVPHCHIHLLPSNSIDHVAFPDRDEAAKERLPQIVERLCQA